MKRLIALALWIGVVAWLGVSPSLAQDINQSGVDAQIRDIEEQFRVAKVKNDVQSLDRILDDSFFETNQNGNSRTKNEMIELFRFFPVQSLTTDSATVRVTGNAALVTGSQTEVNGPGTDRMLFTRVYIRSGNRWRLLASSQFRNPNLPATMQEVNRGEVDGQIRDIEEQFRIAKLKNDVQSLDQILDESFVETNQNGNSRTKDEAIELFRSFPIQSLKTDSSTIRLSDNAAVVTGSQTELNGTGTDRMLFTRVYIRSGDRWRLLASSQFRNPKVAATSR